MDQPNDLAQNDKVETTDQDVMPTSEPQEVQDDQPVTNPEEEVTELDQSEERKPTRLERNLDKALSKKAQLREENERLKTQLGGVEDYIRSGDRTLSKGEEELMSSLFSEDELSSGEIDPRLFQTRVSQFVEQRASKIVNDTLQQREQLSTYRQTVSDHARELDELVESNPELQDPEIQDMFVDLYKSVNYLGDRFIGRESPKKIAEKFFNTAKRISDKQTAELGGRVVKQAQESAVVSSGLSTTNDNGGLANLYNQAVNTGHVDDWAAYFKAMGNN